MVRPSLLLVCLVCASLATACGGVAPTTLSGPAPERDSGPPVRDDAGSPPVGPWLDAGGPTQPEEGGTVDAGSERPCTTSSDCDEDEACAWRLGPDWCSAFHPDGMCVRLVDLPCGVETVVTGCTCAGTTVTWASGCSGLPSDTSPEPLAHAGACDGPVPAIDAGEPGQPDASKAPVGCGSSADCPEGEECGYLVGDCGGPAQCLPSDDFGLLCNSVEVACSCDGTTTILGCDAQASTSPVAFLGECSADAGF